MYDEIDESVLELMLQDPLPGELYQSNVDKEELRNLLLAPAAVADMEFHEAGLNVSAAVKERISVEVDPDGMVSWLTLGKPEEGEERVTEEEIRNMLEDAGVVYGIDDTCILRLLRNPVYNRAFIVARGREVKKGEDALVKYYFNREKEMNPGEPDGAVDFKELNFIQVVKTGELLCERIPGRPGIDGYTVTGKLVPSVSEDIKSLTAGKNTRLEEEGQKLYATCDGEATLKHGVVSVDRILYFDNIDNATGNIRFIGSIVIRGRICEGFTVKATENISVGEVIEDAQVSAGGSIKVGKGMKGGSFGCVSAKEGISSPFIENMKVETEGDLFTNALMNSDVDCKGKLVVTGSKGCIIGGRCRAREIEASQIGNNVNIPTEVEISGIDEIMTKIDILSADLSIQERAVAKLQKSFQEKGGEKKVEIQKEFLAAVYKKNEISKGKRELEETIVLLKQNYSFDIKVRREIYPNVTFKIDSAMTKSRQTLSGSILFYSDGQIIIRAYR